MRSDVPHFRGSASEDDEPRWEAYRALLRRTAASDLDTSRKAKGEPRTFRSITLEEAERAYAEAAPRAGEERMALDFEAIDDPPPTIEPLEIAREAPVRERWRFAPFANRNTRLVSATAAVTAGLVLAASVFPRQQTEPAAIIWDHTRPAGTAPAAPLQAPVHGVRYLPAKATPERTTRKSRAARAAQRTAAGAQRTRVNSSQCAAARAQAQKMHGSLAANAQKHVREACGVRTAHATKPPIGYQTLNF